MVNVKKNFFLGFVLCSISTFLNCNRVSSYPFISGDTFRSIADHIIDETNQDIDFKTIKDGDIIFLKSDYIPYFFDNVYPYIMQPIILITHHGCLSPIYLMMHSLLKQDRSFEKYLDDQNLIVWFAKI